MVLREIDIYLHFWSYVFILPVLHDMQIFDFQEEFQRDAFEALQLQKDAKTQRISQQINMIEEELAGLTLVELQRKEERTDDEIVSMDYTLLRGIQ